MNWDRSKVTNVKHLKLKGHFTALPEFKLFCLFGFFIILLLKENKSKVELGQLNLFLYLKGIFVLLICSCKNTFRNEAPDESKRANCTPVTWTGNKTSDRK